MTCFLRFRLNIASTVILRFFGKWWNRKSWIGSASVLARTANASMKDDSTAAAEAVIMAVRLTRRHSDSVARSVHPQFREVLATYSFHQGMPLTTLPFGDNGTLHPKSLENAITADTACLLVQ